VSRKLRALEHSTAGRELDREALRRLWALFWREAEPAFRLRVAGTVLLLAASALVNALVPLLFARAVDQLTPGKAALLAPAAIVLAYVVAQWLAKLLSELRWALYGPIEQRTRRRLAREALEHLHALSLRFHLARRTGQISRVLDNGLNGMRELLFNAVFLILPLLAEILFVALVMLGRLDAVFAAVLLGTILLYGVAVVWGSEWLRAHQRKAVAEGATAHGKAIDSLLNYETVKYFGNERHVAQRYDQSLALVERLTVKALVFRSLTGMLFVTILGLGMGTILLLAVGRVTRGAMTVGELVLVNTYLLQLIRPMDRLGQLYRSIKQAFVDVEQLLLLLTETPEVQDRPGAAALPKGQGEVRFDHVAFAYDPERPILEGIDFRLPAGRTLAVVGPTGAGKSTIARLLFRFYDPTEGAVLVDGHDLRDVTQASLRAAMAVVPQDAVLFNETIGYNIAFGRPEATREEIEAAARAAELHGFIAGLPDGYDTLVGERGLKLSGGEKQRVAIARAILKRPRILILDEATSALDSATEQAIQRRLRALGRGVTTLVIAHRLSTVIDADEILVLDQGRIVERGTHARLLGRDGLYADLWRRQAVEPESVPAG
jgi:ABC-type transport system involved in Fe-S cluster assembly fused permease/ATPase subunit